MQKMTLLLLSIGLFFLLGGACNEESFQRNQSHADVPMENIREGAKLARQYCQSCHFFPEPSLADSKSWEEGILPNMGPRLGIFKHLYHRYPSAKSDPNVGAGFYPSKPAMSSEDWQHIIDYYSSVSPDQMPQQERPAPLQIDGSGLVAEPIKLGAGAPVISFIKEDNTLIPGTLLSYDIGTESLYRINADRQLIDSTSIGGCIVDAGSDSLGLFLCNIGFINPNNEKLGTVSRLREDEGNRLQVEAPALLDSLARPVQVQPADLDADGKTDFLVCEFGFVKGSLSWYQPGENGRYRKNILLPEPGAIRAYIRDANGDGLADIWVLFAQGDEGIDLFENMGNGKFRRKQILRFPPSWGSTYFEFADMTGDGLEDIIYTCGDNADYSPVLKPYHGLYIFENKGENRFSKSYFYPIHGCYKAVCGDFDGDGLQDIGCISFFADYMQQPAESFVFLKGNLEGGYSAHSLPEATEGRWLVMEKTDLNKDGLPELVIGNFSKGPPLENGLDDRWKKGPALLWIRKK